MVLSIARHCCRPSSVCRIQKATTDSVEEWPSDSFRGREAASQRLGRKRILLETPQWDVGEGRGRNSGLDNCRRDQEALSPYSESNEFHITRFVPPRGA